MNKILTVEPRKLNDEYRVIVVSDIHGGIDLFEELLKKVNLNESDYLVIIGDFLQRGYYNTQILNKMKDLVKRPNTFVLSGNHEQYICKILEKENIERFKYHCEVIDYGCILGDWIRKSNLKNTNYVTLQNDIKRIYKDELDFLRNLPYALELGGHIFVHAGIEDIEDWKTSKTSSLLSFPAFFDSAHINSKFVVVGHWPIQNYRENSLSGDIIIDEDKRIIAIDGGYGVKSTGQINALIINSNESYSYEKVSVDHFRKVKIKCDVPFNNEKVVKLDWTDRAYEIIEKRDEFSICLKKSTNEEFLLKNEFILVEDGEYKLIDDYISLFISAKKGEFVRLIDYYGSFALVKRDGEIGWINSIYLDD